MNLRYPNITGKTPVEQIAQLRGFLYQLVEELNLQQSNGTVAVERLNAGNPITEISGGGEGEQMSPLASFNQIKNLIIKSADIVDAYYAEINRRLEGVYVAESEFGVYTKTVEQRITENADEITRQFARIEKLTGEMEQLIGTDSYVRQGLLFTVGEENLEEELGQALPDGTPVYGVEVGQTVVINENEVFRKFARFTSYGMSLYDRNGNLSAYITDKRMNIPNCVITVSLARGGFQETIKADGSSVERWVV